MPDSVFPFRLAKSGFKYLGINMAHNFKGLYEKKITQLLIKLKSYLQKWILHLSLAGRVNCVKMTVLPIFLYLFQCLPIFLSKDFFQQTRQIYFQFYMRWETP